MYNLSAIISYLYIALVIIAVTAALTLGSASLALRD